MRLSTLLVTVLQPQQEDDMAVPKRLMLFVDGENLVMRYQNMIEQGYIPLPIDNKSLFYLKNIYLWSVSMPLPNPNVRLTNIDIVRAYYYTSLTGDENKQRVVDEEIRKMSIGGTSVNGLSTTLYPVTFKKHRQDIKAKGVDIRMTIDILSHTYDNNLDAVCFFSGDGDFEPVLQEVIEHGKQIFIYSFSMGFNPNLRKVCDQFFNIDHLFFDLSKSPTS
jgi:uncharacterized LabA/DUF88 family protein